LPPVRGPSLPSCRGRRAASTRTRRSRSRCRRAARSPADGAVYDLVTAPAAAREFNRAHELQLLPTAITAKDGVAPGLRADRHVLTADRDIRVVPPGARAQAGAPKCATRHARCGHDGCDRQSAMRKAVVAATLAVLAARAHAQAPGLTPISDPEIPPVRGPSPAPVDAPVIAPAPVAAAVPMAPIESAPHKSRALALALSIGGTAAGFALISIGSDRDDGNLVVAGAAAVFFGPSFGHWYAGDGAIKGLALRSSGVVLEVLGLMQMSFGDCIGDCERRHDDDRLAATMVVGGSALFVIGGIYDIATAPGAASDWNARHALTIVPTAIRASDGVTPGVALTGRF
jgi:hypothetical protein